MLSNFSCSLFYGLFCCSRMNSNVRRLQKELADMRAINSSSIEVLKADDSNISRWTLLIMPDAEPYNEGAFKVAIEFPAEYPFKPPVVRFETKIHHPNVDETGQVCLSLVNSENWKPATRTHQVMEALLKLITEPELSSPLRGDLAEEYKQNKGNFFKAAKEHTKTFAEKRVKK